MQRGPTTEGSGMSGMGMDMDPSASSRTQAWAASIARQASFSRGYSPLYAAILDCLAGWLRESEDGRDARVGLLRQRFWTFVSSQVWDNDLEPILKLAATLHSAVLRGDSRVAGLRPYYRTVTPDGPMPDEPGFAGELLTALDRLGEELLAHAHRWEIQTNETARGVLWLVPAALLQIEAAYLVELGASAGLNLLADHRGFSLRWPEGPQVKLGHAEPAQFEIACEGAVAALSAGLSEGASDSSCVVAPPEILGRVGADARLIDLDAPAAETELAACIWGDQPQRMQRLQEALELRRSFRGTPQAPRLMQANLPDEAEEFLRAAVPAQPVAPVILFDTYVTAYFNDVDHRALVRAVEAFARSWTLRHKLPWLWVRFEPPRAGEPAAPQVGWCRWWVEVWTQKGRHTIELGWGHPHCVRLVFGPGVSELARLRGPE
ncbi:MAG: DUF2332 family protein [Nannocystis sp.]|nr:DUF2332 family protein [Nannocystis sp.]MBA3546111.1 DUF2332 family protein [Nannocystis sp.]